MLDDHYGNSLSTRSDAAVKAYDEGVRFFLGANYGSGDAFAMAVAADEAFALGHVGLARAKMMQGQMAEAKGAISRAQDLAGGVTLRERQHIEAFSLLLSGKAADCRALVRDHVRTFPRDALAAQLCSNVFGLIGFSGEVGREADLLAYTGSLLPHYPGDWWMMSVHAVSLCETGRIKESV